MNTFRRTLLFALIFGLGLALVQPAQAQGRFGLLVGGYQPEEEDEADADITPVYGLEYGHRFNSRFGVSASLSRIDLADSFGLDDSGDLPFSPEIDVELTNLDLSLEWYPTGGRFVILGGPGLSRLDFDANFFGPADEPISVGETEDLLSFHLGVGYQWNLGEHWSLRPEVRARRIFDNEPEADLADGDVDIFYESTDVEARVTLAYRLGT